MKVQIGIIYNRLVKDIIDPQDCGRMSDFLKPIKKYAVLKFRTEFLNNKMKTKQPIEFSFKESTPKIIFINEYDVIPDDVSGPDLKTNIEWITECDFIIGLSSIHYLHFSDPLFEVQREVINRFKIPYEEFSVSDSSDEKLHNFINYHIDEMEKELLEKEEEK